MFLKRSCLLLLGLLFIFTLFAMEFNVNKDTTELKVLSKKKVIFNTFPSDFFLELISADVKIVPAKDNNIYFMIEYYEYEKGDAKFGITNGQFVTISKANKGPMVSKLIAYIPENTNLQVKLISGDLYIGDLTSSTIDINTVSGDIYLQTMNHLATLRASSSSGEIQMISIKTAKDLSLNNISGDIDINESSAPNLNLKVVSSDVRIASSSFNTAELKTVSGDINLTKTDIKELDANTISGDLVLKNSMIQSKRFDTTSGDVIEEKR